MGRQRPVAANQARSGSRPIAASGPKPASRRVRPVAASQFDAANVRVMTDCCRQAVPAYNAHLLTPIVQLSAVSPSTSGIELHGWATQLVVRQMLFVLATYPSLS
jgi:hypothetical protein